MSKQKQVKKAKQTTTGTKPHAITWRVAVPLLLFVLAWAWSAWWMGDVWRIARERSFLAADPTLSRAENDLLAAELHKDRYLTRDYSKIS